MKKDFSEFQNCLHYIKNGMREIFNYNEAFYVIFENLVENFKKAIHQYTKSAFDITDQNLLGN